MIDATVAPKVGFISPFGTTACNVNHINAGHEPRPEAEVKHKLEGVGLHALVRLGLCVWMPLLLYPALSPLRSRIKKSRGHPIYCLTRGDRAANASSTMCSLICSMPNPARVAAIT